VHEQRDLSRLGARYGGRPPPLIVRESEEPVQVRRRQRGTEFGVMRREAPCAAPESEGMSRSLMSCRSGV